MGSLSAARRRGAGPRPRSNGSAAGPLRKVVSSSYSGDRCFETYECGHSAEAKRDLMGYTNAVRRRCRECKREVPDFTEWPGWLLLDGYAGQTKQAVAVVGETPQKYRVRAAGPEPVRLGGRSRWLAGDATALVPKRAISRRDATL